MNPEEWLRKLWRTGGSGLPVQPEALLESLQREERRFRRGLLAGDLGMVALSCGLLLVVGWLFCQAARQPSQPGIAEPSLVWPALLLALPLAGLALFLVIERLRSRGRAARPDDSSTAYVKSLLAQLERRIWLFRNVFWWFILPIICVADFGFRLYMAWWVGTVTGETHEFIVTILRAFLESIVAGTAVFFFFRWLIKRYLGPRRAELVALLKNLEPEPADG